MVLSVTEPTLELEFTASVDEFFDAQPEFTMDLDGFNPLPHQVWLNETPAPILGNRNATALTKGKEKSHSQYTIMKNGILGQQADKILEEGRLLHIHKVFNSPEVDIDKEVF